jgi:hypothetical protein
MGMVFETSVVNEPVDPATVLVARWMGYARMVFPVDEVPVDCLVVRYAGARPGSGASPMGERCLVALPGDSISAILETMAAAGEALFPGRVRPGGLGGVGRNERGGPWIKLSHCGVAAYGPDGVVTHACCPSFVCKDMVALVGAGVLADHISNPALGGSGARCDWSGVGVVDDRADWMASGDVPAGWPTYRPWRRR